MLTAKKATPWSGKKFRANNNRDTSLLLICLRTHLLLTLYFLS